MPHVPGQYLVRFHTEQPEVDFLDRLKRAPGGQNLRLAGPVSRQMNIWLFEQSGAEPVEQFYLDWFRRQPEVSAAQFNHILEYRQTAPLLLPDDPLFYQQWQHVNTGAGGGTPNADLDSDLAWDITTGGLSPLGDTIVVAVIDGGLDANHEDLQGNLWRNYSEIPGDSLDNDHNGYVDDYRGWNVYQNNDNIAGNTTGHGTPVASVIAARGNNALGVSGINWQVKLMFVAGNSLESQILKAYDYVLNARKTYNRSAGKQGAFVVAVNCSWGITYGQPGDAPLWCAAFDSLGAAGILSVAATANAALNIDSVGDLPTACPSAFLVSVTNLNKWDQKSASAAWGATTIDLGAYGKDIFTAGPNNTYGFFSGTSFAAPQVSGAVALLYSAPCDNLAYWARGAPALAALRVKQSLLGSAVPNASLLGKTVSGGRLGLYHLLQDYEDSCQDCLAPFAVQISALDKTTLRLDWPPLPQWQQVGLRWRKKGEPIWAYLPEVSPPWLLSGLQTCTSYEFSLRGLCNALSWSEWSPEIALRTKGCCAAPAFISISQLSDSTAALHWSPSAGAKNYELRLRPAGGVWQTWVSAAPAWGLSDLQPCTTYELELRSSCGTDSISDPVFYAFDTPGCSRCAGNDYCPATAESASTEWIGSVQIGSWINLSGGGPGYVDYTRSPVAPINLPPGLPLPVTIQPAYSGQAYKAFFRIFIDYNANGVFTDPGELAFDPGFASDAPVTGWISAPDNVSPGPSRLRVLMKYNDGSSGPPGPCESFLFGQIEDYCVYLGPIANTAEMNPAGRIEVFPQPASDRLLL
ncbi:MAG: S8 family serine peptidase, partial [Saprospiraceae bacterium]|nr:S8 family serine peptidase [Saprospiraceae bacterium]